MWKKYIKILTAPQIQGCASISWISALLTDVKQEMQLSNWTDLPE